MAAEHGQEAVVRLLLEKGANIDAKYEDGETALVAAAVGRHEAVVRLLLEKGADVKAQNRYGATALMKAVQYEKECEWSEVSEYRAIIRLLTPNLES